MAKPTITYFDIRGRAEPIRLILEELGIEYDDQQVSADDWTELKSKTPFGWLLAYREGDLEIWQSHAIYVVFRGHGGYAAYQQSGASFELWSSGVAIISAVTILTVAFRP